MGAKIAAPPVLENQVKGGYLLLPLSPFMPIIGVLIVKKSGQPARDRNRKTYLLDYPPDMTPEMVNGFIHAIAGSLRMRRFVSSPTLSAEMWGTPEEGIRHFLKVPRRYE